MNDAAITATPDIDPVTLEILGHQFRATAEEMAIALSRTARTTYVREAADFGTALATPAGKFFGYPAALGVSGFLDLDAGPALAAAGPYTEGDVLITNHPYDSGGLSSHMPDLQLLRPYFHDGRIVACGWAFVHTADIGGMVPSSIAPDLDELFQEGLILPPIKLVEAGRMNRDIVTLYSANCRMPEANLGDIQAMLTALETGARRVADLIARHGVDVFEAAQQALADYAKAKSLKVRRQIPDGKYTFWDYLDDDYVSRIPIRVRCEMTVSDGAIHLDFRGTDPQVPAAYNVPTGGTRHPWLTLKLMQFVASYDKSIPLNHGIFKDITVSVPKGSLLNPVFPAAVGIRSAAAIRIGDVLTGCLAIAAPNLIPAPSGGTVVPTVLAEYDAALGTRRVQVMQSLVGGTGARLGADGVDGRDTSLANCFNTPTEASEAEVGAVVLHYGLRSGSGGPGKWRGGTGLIFTMRIDNHGSAVLGRGLERYVFRPFGLMGGRPGTPARVVQNLGREDECELGKISMVEPKPGDTVTLMSAGGGGYGDPFERPKEAVLRDVRAGFVNVDEARTDYGVVIENGNINFRATETLRTQDRPSPAPFEFGPEREAWDRVFTDTRMLVLTDYLLSKPPALATRLRAQLFSDLLPDLGQMPLDELLTDPETLGQRLDDMIAKIANS